MPLNAPQPDTTKLERSPLELVVCQIRHESRPHVADTAFAMGLYAGLGGAQGAYPTVNLVGSAEINVAFGPGGAQVAGGPMGATGLEISSEDQRWAVSFLPDHYAVQTTAYETWEDFRRRLRDVTEVAAEHLRPTLALRVGLRYVDRIRELRLDGVDAWNGYLAPSVLGLAADDRFKGTVTAFAAQYRLDLGDGVSANVSAQPVVGDASGEVPFQLDYDVFVDRGRQFETEAIMETVEALHTRARQLFALTITDALLEKLK